MSGPDYDRVASVVVDVALRLVQKGTGKEGRRVDVAYCRVSTEEQAAEGWSIAAQADRLRAYAALRDLGPVTVIEDPGQSAKDTNRPGLQQLLTGVAEGHVSNVLIWRLDRLSRNLGDLIELADKLGKANVGLYSFTEQLDLTSATGRVFYNILGAFAQFYREQLAENVAMGMSQAVRQGKWINRPKTGLTSSRANSCLTRWHRLSSESSDYEARGRATARSRQTRGSTTRPSSAS